MYIALLLISYAVVCQVYGKQFTCYLITMQTRQQEATKHSKSDMHITGFTIERFTPTLRSLSLFSVCTGESIQWSRLHPFVKPTTPSNYPRLTSNQSRLVWHQETRANQTSVDWDHQLDLKRKVPWRTKTSVVAETLNPQNVEPSDLL